MADTILLCLADISNAMKPVTANGTVTKVETESGNCIESCE